MEKVPVSIKQELDLLNRIEKQSGRDFQLWDSEAIYGCQVEPGVFCVKTQTSLPVSCHKASQYLSNPLMFHKWILGCESSGEALSIKPYGSVVHWDMKTSLFKILPQKYQIQVFTTIDETEKEVVTYFKSVNTHFQVPEFFICISTEVFPGQEISFLKAQIVLRSQKSVISDFFTKQFALSMAQSIRNLQGFMHEEDFREKTSQKQPVDLSVQIEKSQIKHGIEVKKKEFEYDEGCQLFEIADDAQGELNANISHIQSRRTQMVRIQEKMVETTPFGSPEKEDKRPSEARNMEFLEPYEYVKYGKYKGSPVKGSYVYEDEEEKSHFEEEKIFTPEKQNSGKKEIVKVEEEIVENGNIEKIDENEVNGENKEIEEEKQAEDWREKCYQDGIWHKWVVERLNEEEKEIYLSLKERLEKENIFLSENKMLRFLAAREFDEDAAYEMLQTNVEFYKKHDVETLDEEEFQSLIDKQTIIPHKTDKYGRPVLYMRLRLSKPKESTDRQLMQYMLWTMKEVSRRMPAHCDNYILVYDLKDAGLSNFSLSQMGGAAKETGSQFPERMYKILVLNSNWIVKWSWGAIKKLMYPKTIEKVKFFDNSELPEAIQEFIPIENIPVEFGGQCTEYGEKFLQ